MSLVTTPKPRVKKKPRRIYLIDDDEDIAIWRSLIGAKPPLSVCKVQSQYLAALQMGMKERNCLELLGMTKLTLEQWRTKYKKWFPIFEKQAIRKFEYIHLQTIARASGKDYKASLALLERHSSTKEDYAVAQTDSRIVVELNFQRGEQAITIPHEVVGVPQIEAPQ